jgi:hypothetical protein
MEWIKKYKDKVDRYIHIMGAFIVIVSMIYAINVYQKTTQEIRERYGPDAIVVDGKVYYKGVDPRANDDYRPTSDDDEYDFVDWIYDLINK